MNTPNLTHQKSEVKASQQETRFPPVWIQLDGYPYAAIVYMRK
ncbi:MAG: hypothetical protein WC891_08945 [Actinomycetota bacterium]|jgi:hypothetical protein